MRITQSSGYAIAAVFQIANLPAGELLACSALSRAGKMPERFVLQLLRKLVNDRILTSVRGRRGGYKLSRPASRISLLEIIESIDGPLGTYAKIELPGMAPRSVSVVETGIDGAIEAARKRLAAITLADLRGAKAA